jgi:hypothetical protein
MTGIAFSDRRSDNRSEPCVVSRNRASAPTEPDQSMATPPARKLKRINYRKLAVALDAPLCAHCEFGVPAVLEVAHLDADRANNDVLNLVILCPNCHKMHDLDLISTATIIEMRDRPKVVTWSKRMKDAGQKAALRRLRRAAGRKAVETRRRRQAGRSAGTASSVEGPTGQ